VLRYCLFFLCAAAAGGQVYDLSGRITPAGRGSVTLFGATQPFTASTLTDDAGGFNFRKLAAATYTLAVFLPGRGEARQTIEVAPAWPMRAIVSDLDSTEGFDPDPRPTGAGTPSRAASTILSACPRLRRSAARPGEAMSRATGT
jgi:hypothetical protein